MGEKKDDLIFVCSDCGSDDIQVKMWVDPNTHEICDTASDGEIDDNWCNDCGEHTRLITKEEFDN